VTRYRVRFEGSFEEDAEDATLALIEATRWLAGRVGGDALTRVVVRPAGQTEGKGMMGSYTIPDWARRAVRTFAQSFVGSFLVLTAGAGLLPGEVPNLALLQRLALAALWAAVIATLTGAHNALEDKNIVPALGKAPASAGAHPIPDPPRRLELHDRE
jgi:hypothetical protein